jgi:hypothetical protein
MMKTNPITPPRELVREWYGSEDCPDGANALANYLCTQAAQWGADQELEACCEWVRTRHHIDLDGYDQLRAARRPRPPSLKEQALAALGPEPQPKIGHSWDTTLNCRAIERHRLVRRALEALDD